jgi:hypothetical protein
MRVLALPLILVALAAPLQAGPQGCPPGLAKKSPACVPPGLAKKQHHDRYRVGDRIDRDYIVIRDPDRYGLDPGQSYYRAGNYVYRVDRETREVLDLIGAIAAVLD